MDAIWGEIEVTPFAQQFLDVYEFQRMRFMKQLGPCNFVYTCAETSRFAHSLGVYHLARQVLLSMKHSNVGRGYVIRDRQIELISVAALYHDIGHGPFSHTFDKLTGTSHEERSKQILELVIDKYKIPVKMDEIRFMQSVIDPPKHLKMHWAFQIVSRDLIDVDRMDYVVRDAYATGMTTTFNSKNALKFISRAYISDQFQVAFPTNINYVVTDLKNSRDYLYERVYHHKTAIKVEKLLATALTSTFREVLNDMDKFLMLNDSVLTNLYATTKEQEIKDAIEKLFTRQF